MVQLGYGATREREDNEYKLSDHGIKVAITIDSGARDDGETTLRKGLVLGKVTSTGKYKEYDDTAGDGTEVAAGLLDEQVDLLDETGSAADSQTVMLIHGHVDESKLHGIDASGKSDLAQIIFG